MSIADHSSTRLSSFITFCHILSHMLSFSADFHEGGFGVGKCVSQLLSGYAPHLESLFLEMTRNDHKVVGPLVPCERSPIISCTSNLEISGIWMNMMISQRQWPHFWTVASFQTMVKGFSSFGEKSSLCCWGGTYIHGSAVDGNQMAIYGYNHEIQAPQKCH